MPIFAVYTALAVITRIHQRLINVAVSVSATLPAPGSSFANCVFVSAGYLVTR